MNGTTLDRFKIVSVQDAQALLEGMNIADTTSPQDLSKSGIVQNYMPDCVCYSSVSLWENEGVKEARKLASCKVWEAVCCSPNFVVWLHATERYIDIVECSSILYGTWHRKHFPWNVRIGSPRVAGNCVFKSTSKVRWNTQYSEWGAYMQTPRPKRWTMQYHFSYVRRNSDVLVTVKLERGLDK